MVVSTMQRTVKSERIFESCNSTIGIVLHGRDARDT